MAENKNLDAFAGLDAMDAHVDDWRDAVKGKQRGIFSFDDVVNVKLKTLKKRIYTDIESIPAWKMKECIYKGVGDYEYLYDEWKDLNVGDRWGNNGWIQTLLRLSNLLFLHKYQRRTIHNSLIQIVHSVQFLNYPHCLL